MLMIEDRRIKFFLSAIFVCCFFSVAQAQNAKFSGNVSVGFSYSESLKNICAQEDITAGIIVNNIFIGAGAGLCSTNQPYAFSTLEYRPLSRKNLTPVLGYRIGYQQFINEEHVSGIDNGLFHQLRVGINKSWLSLIAAIQLSNIIGIGYAEDCFWWLDISNSLSYSIGLSVVF